MFLLIELIHSFVVYMQSNHVNSKLQDGLILICVFGSICLLNGGNTSNSLNYFSKTVLIGHKAHSLEVHQKCSNFQFKFILLGLGNGSVVGSWVW